MLSSQQEAPSQKQDLAMPKQTLSSSNSICIHIELSNCGDVAFMLDSSAHDDDFFDLQERVWVF